MTRPRTILILGGTGEGLALADALLAEPGLHVISSLAGRVANPKLPAGEVRVGGFGGVAGLADYLRSNGIAAMIDATHPFARRMGWHAAEAAAAARVPLLRLERPAWVAQAGDNWTWVDNWDEAVEILRKTAQCVFLALGRQELAPFAALDNIAFVIRAVDQPDPQIKFAHAEFILARGPFRLDDERALLQSRSIDCIVCKNSGGSATDAKLQAARERGIHVVIQRRPPRPETTQVSTVAAAVDWVRSL
jgi:precorrin-6A/cobalt-precorrin-6A reductase